KSERTLENTPALIRSDRRRTIRVEGNRYLPISTFSHHLRLTYWCASNTLQVWYDCMPPIEQSHWYDESPLNPFPHHEYQIGHLNIYGSSQNILCANPGIRHSKVMASA